MHYTFNYPAELYDETKLDLKMILTLIQKHRTIEYPSLRKNRRYYDAEHKIIDKERKEGAPNAKIVCNHAKDIADTASGYFMGNPITYSNTADSDIEPLLTAFDIATVDDADSENALNMAVYGVAYEYIYMIPGSADLAVKTLEPENTFLVYDDTIEQNVLFGIYYYLQKDDVNDSINYIATVVTEKLKYNFVLYDSMDFNNKATKYEEHYIGMVPIIEYKNNKDKIGDYEQQISLIDAYNTLMSDRINDKEQFIDALLVLYGSQFGDDEEETVKAAEALRELKLLELPGDAKAEYLTRTLDENSVETLRKALKEDIYTFSHVPNLTDENFVGNSSGVAMEYKLLGLEMITKTKERYYRKGLRSRIKIFCNFLSMRKLMDESNSIVPRFSRALPKNLVEIAQTISALKGTVSQKTLLQLLPFVEDPDKEIEDVDIDNEKALIQQKKLFGNEPNYPPEDGDIDE